MAPKSLTVTFFKIKIQNRSLYHQKITISNPSLSLSLQPRFYFLSQETQERGIFLKPQEKWPTTNRKKPREEEERKIPVLTVPRNSAILKNIFVINNSTLASPTSSELSIESEENIQETEEILTFGRHPDCNIV